MTPFCLSNRIKCLNKIDLCGFNWGMENNIRVAVVGAGISGMAAAIELAHNGCQVSVFEKSSSYGGRGQILRSGEFLFDLGPSWYWMPDVFEQFFNEYGKSTQDYFNLVRLDPSYSIFYKSGRLDVPAGLDACCRLFESRELGSSVFLRRFIEDGRFKYTKGMQDFVRKPSLSWREFLDFGLIKSFFQLDMIKSLESVVERNIKDEVLRMWLCFPVLFLGAKPSKTPALYSLMNYAEIELGTWYPMGGMHQLFKALYELAIEKNVKFHFNAPVEKITVKGRAVSSIILEQEELSFEAIVGSADYHHIETKLLDHQDRQYSDKYWDSRQMAPSALIYYLGVKGKIDELQHHNLFFDTDFDHHASAIYDTGEWPAEPLFYVCMPSKTDPGVAPEGHENLFILIPLASGIQDDHNERRILFDKVLDRLEKRIGKKIRDKIVCRHAMGPDDFKSTFNSYKGNAYGLANVLEQTAILKPRIKHNKIKGMYYSGQLSHPGPGLPPSLISGQITAKQLLKDLSK